MVGIEDGYDLYMAGAKLELGAYVSVSLFGDGTAEQYENMTQEICRIMEAELGHSGKLRVCDLSWHSQLGLERNKFLKTVRLAPVKSLVKPE